MFKLSARISSLLQQSDIAAFSLHFTSPPKGLNLSTKKHQKISKKTFFHPYWENQHTHRSIVFHLGTVNCILMIC